MRTISEQELKEILGKHQKWLNDGEGGERADLRSANLRSANLRSADLSSADLRYANLRYADLSSADLSSADLRYADLSSANLSSANLRYANLRSADLSSADLRYADLRYANLRSANLRSATGTYYITQRSDGYQFFLCEDEGKFFIRAGCQYMSIDYYREHTKSYSDEDKRAETLLILDFAEAKLNLIARRSEAA